MPPVARLCVCGCGATLTGRQLKYFSETCKKRGTRETWLNSTYDISGKDYDKILLEQGGCCGICKRKPKPGEVFHVDHEHREGQSGPVRGILCPYCNTRLVGRLKSAEKAQAMADYLRDPPATRALGREAWAKGRPKKKRVYRTRRKKS